MLPCADEEPSVGGSARSSKIRCDPPPSLAAEGCKSDVERVASASGPGQELHVGYRTSSQRPPSTASIHFADRPHFRTPRIHAVGGDDRPLACPTRRQGTVVSLGTHPDADTGKAFRNHVPLTTRIHINDTTGTPLSSLLDTGASLSVIDADLLRRLGGSPTGTPMRVNGLGNTHTLGWAKITFFLPSNDSHNRPLFLEYTQDFHVIPEFGPGLCLGLDFISTQGVTVDPRNERALVGRYSFAITERLPQPYAREAELCARVECFLPPKTLTWVPVDTACLAPGIDYTIHPRVSVTADASVKLAGPTAVADANARHVLIANSGDCGITLARRTPVADAVAAHVGDAQAHASHVFNLGARLPAGHLMTASASPTTWTVDEDGNYTSPASEPLDLFENAHEDDHGIMRDAHTTLVDDHFKVGVNADGVPPPALVACLRRHKEAFALDGRPGRVHGPEMSIELEPQANLHPEPPRRTSPEKRAAMDKAIDQLLEWDVIEPSNSPVSFPVLMVRQYGKWRFCVDYRQLNAATVPDRYPLPTTDAVFHTLMGKRVFSSLDAIRGYHQLGVAEKDRWKTAFTCHRGLFQYRTVPFGLRNAPSVFQRVMDELLGSLRWNEAVVYIDDTVVGTLTLEEHVTALDTLLQRAISVGLKFSPAKCTFGVPSLTLLGRKVSGAGVAVWHDRAKAVQDLPCPRTLSDLYHVLGLFNYYRSFIHRYAQLAEPLTRLTRGMKYDLRDGRKRLIAPGGDVTSADKVQLDWSDEQQRSFDRLKAAISTPPVLAHPDPARPYVLYVDASKSGFAAILHQVFASGEQGPPPDARSASVHTLALPGPVSTEQWARWVRADPAFRSALSVATEEGDTAPWTLRDGVLLRRMDGRLALPDAAIPLVMRALHDQRGHFGITKTYLAVSKQFWRPRLVDTVQAWIRHCPSCQRTKIARPVGDLSIDQDSRFPFETLSVDLVLGLPRSRGGNDALLCMQDAFSRMVLLHPCHASIDAPGIAAVISDRVLRYGWRPRRLISDSEPKMTGTVMQALAASLHAELTPSPPHHQQANFVERAIQTIQQVLQTLCATSHAHWDRVAAPAAELAFNSSPHSATGYRPFDLVFVAQPDVVHAVFGLDDPEQVGSFAERLTAAHSRLDEAREALRTARSRQKERYDQRRRPLEPLAVGDQVYIRLSDRPIGTRPPHKLAPHKRGPFQVAEVLSPHRVRLSLPVDLGIGDEFSVEQLDRLPPSPDPFQRQLEPSPPASPLLAPQPSALEEGLPARLRNLPAHLRDFHVATLGSSPGGATLTTEHLRGPLFRPKHVTIGDQALTLVERPVAFLSRLTYPAEQRLVAAELELCCLAWAFAKWAHLLEGAELTVVTDHAPMSAMLQSASSTHYGPTITRCRALLLPHLPNMRFVHRPGSSHANADSLSRLTPSSAIQTRDGLA